MFKAILWIIAISLLVWTGYAIYDMTNWKNELSPTSIFSEKDEKVLVIHKPNSFNWSQIEFPTLIENKNIIDPLLSNLPASCNIYLSKSRNLILLENTFDWDEQSLRRILSKSNVRYSISNGEIRIEQFNALMKKNKLLILKYEEDVEGNEFNWDQIDKNSAASIVVFSKSKIDFTDIFVKNENTIEFHSKNANGIEGNIVDDILTFQPYIPTKATDYLFFESKYLSSIDPSFKKSPISSFTDIGLVSFKIGGQSVFISHFKEGQNAVQNLNEYYNKQEDNSMEGWFDNLLLSEKLGARKENYYVKTIDNIALFAKSKELIDSTLKEIELGKTWFYNEEELNKYRKDLPKLVSYRSFGKLKNLSISILNDKIIQTEVKYKSESLKINTDLDYLSVSISGKIKDFASFNGRGNLVCLTEEGMIYGVENGIKTWKKNISDSPIGGVQVLRQNNKDVIVVTSKKSIHALDRFGKYLDGFPVKLEQSDFSCQANAFLLKGEFFVGSITTNSELIVFNSKGEKSKRVKYEIADDVLQIDFFHQKNKLFCLLRSDLKTILYNVDDKKIEDKLDVGNSVKLTDMPNGFSLLYINQGKITEWINNKGGDSDNKPRAGLESDFMVSTKLIDSSLYSISMLANKVVVASNLSKKIFDKDFGSSRISQGDIFKNSFKETYFAMVDATENRLYLYDNKGRMYVKGSIEGSKKVLLNQAASSSVTVTTMLEGYLVQYFIK